MIDKINISKIIGISGFSNNGRPVADKAKSEKASDINFSAQASLLQKMMESEPPKVDLQKVEQLKQAIERGEYEIDYNKLANLLVDQNLD